VLCCSIAATAYNHGWCWGVLLHDCVSYSFFEPNRKNVAARTAFHYSWAFCVTAYSEGCGDQQVLFAVCKTQQKNWVLFPSHLRKMLLRKSKRDSNSKPLDVFVFLSQRRRNAGGVNHVVRKKASWRKLKNSFLRGEALSLFLFFLPPFFFVFRCGKKACGKRQLPGWSCQ